MRIKRRHLGVPAVLIGGTALACLLVPHLLKRVRHRQEAPQSAELDAWEDEGGSVSAVGARAGDSGAPS